MAHLLVTFKGKNQRRKLEGPLVIGRGLDCDLCLEDSALSRRHCRIEPQGNGWVVLDLNSRNSTRLNGHRIALHQLHEGDAIHIGNTRVTFHTHDFAPERPADPTAALLNPARKLPPPRHAAPTRPLPTPKIANAETITDHEVSGFARPLPFTRLPARPIVKPQQDE